MTGAHVLPLIDFPTVGWAVGQWIEAMLVRGRGDVQGDAVVLDDEELMHICWAYRIYPQGHEQAGRRMVHRAFYCRSKGAAKSELSAMICCAEALGPVRCDGFDAAGEPVGVPVLDPYVRVVATEEGQASNIYGHVSYMLTNGRAGSEYKLDVGRSAATSTRIFISPSGEIVPATSGDVSKDGGRESFAAVDETHLFTTPPLKRMYGIVMNNLGKRKGADPWCHLPTTAWMPGEHSVAEDAYKKHGALPVREAVERNGVLFDMRSGDEPKIFGRNDSLMIALKTAYAPAKQSWTDFHKIVRLIRDSEDPEQTAYRFFLNIPYAGSSQWLSPKQIELVLGEVKVEPGDSIAVGFDGSESDDHTALIGCAESGDLFALGLWTPSGQPRWREDVDEAVEATFAMFKVVRFYGDPAWWQEELARWARKHGSPPIVEFWTGQRNESKVAVATGALKTAITRESADEGRITIDPVPRFTDEIKRDGRSLLRWHFENTKARKRRIRIEDKTEDAWILRKEAPSSPLKIDGAIASILARRARDDAVREGEFERKVYARAAW